MRAAYEKSLRHDALVCFYLGWEATVKHKLILLVHSRKKNAAHG